MFFLGPPATVGDNRRQPATARLLLANASSLMFLVLSGWSSSDLSPLSRAGETVTDVMARQRGLQPQSLRR
jgi:hypothetical protein